MPRPARPSCLAAAHAAAGSLTLPCCCPALPPAAVLCCCLPACRPDVHHLVVLLAVLSDRHTPAHTRPRVARRTAHTHGTRAAAKRVCPLAHTHTHKARHSSQPTAQQRALTVAAAGYSTYPHSVPGLKTLRRAGGVTDLPSATAMPMQGGRQGGSGTKAGSGCTPRGRCCAGCGNNHMGRDEPFRSRAWYPFNFGAAPHLEPIFKVVLPLFGVLIELYIGWGGWR